MKRAALDPSRRLDLYLRINRAASKIFTFVDENSAAYSLIYEDFQIIIKRYPGDKQNVLLLEIGSGLTILDGNGLEMSITESQSNLQPGDYYWEMYKPDDGQTWLNGKLFFHQGEFDGVIVDPTTLQVEEDSNIQITINL